VKKCVTCHETKPLDDFNVRRASSDGRQPRCRQCWRDYYLQNTERVREAVGRRIERVQAAHRSRLAEHLAAHPCIDCGESDIRVLDFDHRDGVDKRADVARMVGASMSWPRIEQEIAKCDVRCANCHRKRTSESAGWWRQAVFVETGGARTRLAAARLAGLFPDAAR
jgi:hypothetical protein